MAERQTILVTGAAEALQRFPNVDGLVLSVGAFLQDGPTVLPNGHEAMFAANVLGPFLFTEILSEKLKARHGLVAHVIAPFREQLDWDDLEGFRVRRPMVAFNRQKVCNRVIAGEMARRYPGQICSVAYDPAFVLDKSDPDLKKRWPKGFAGFVWSAASLLFARHPSVAGEPLAELMLTGDRDALNGAMVKLNKRVARLDRAMSDTALGSRLWQELQERTGLAQAGRE